MSITNYLTFAGGLGLLLYGIKLMGEGLELAAGSRLKHLLEKMTNLQNLAKNLYFRCFMCLCRLNFKGELL